MNGRKTGVLQELADDNHLPDKIEEDARELFHEEDYCEFCNVKFNKTT